MLSALTRIFRQEDINFLVTNRIPRRYATRLAGWFSRIENPLLARASIRVWEAFAGDLRLEEAKKQRFDSLQDCFVRELRDGARPIDPDPEVVVTPCDAEVGAFGRVEDMQLFQIKGLPYRLADLVGDPAAAEKHQDSVFVTLRLKSSMYHRFHAPCDLRVTHVHSIAGDTWNVNPIALKRVERLFCRNARAVIDVEVPFEGAHLTLVPVAAILVSGIKLRFLDEQLQLADACGTSRSCDAHFRKGEELGHFLSGSTLVVLASGPFSLSPNVAEGSTVRMGQPLLRRTLNGITHGREQ
ncbi:MAG TPA: archaetidylserine decarboxylase [Myxococcaceae bacterium]|nr:archaetidylserine decarboxylase [Myxococcaceae bacterium]